MNLHNPQIIRQLLFKKLKNGYTDNLYQELCTVRNIKNWLDMEISVIHKSTTMVTFTRASGTRYITAAMTYMPQVIFG